MTFGNTEKGSEKDLLLGSINCMESSNVCALFDIQDYPTLLAVKNDTAY